MDRSRRHDVSPEVLDMLAVEYVRQHVTPETKPYEYVTLYWFALDHFDRETPSKTSLPEST